MKMLPIIKKEWDSGYPDFLYMGRKPGLAPQKHVLGAQFHSFNLIRCVSKLFGGKDLYLKRTIGILFHIGLEYLNQGLILVRTRG